MSVIGLVCLAYGVGLLVAVASITRSRGPQAASRRSISARPSTRWRRRSTRGRSSCSSSSTGSATIQPQRRAKRSTLCSVASALAAVLADRPARRGSSRSSATSSTVSPPPAPERGYQVAVELVAVRLERARVALAGDDLGFETF